MFTIRSILAICIALGLGRLEDMIIFTLPSINEMLKHEKQ